jgi:hypothetical protein
MMAVGVVALAAAIAAIPVLATEQARDWLVYRHAAEQLALGLPIYRIDDPVGRLLYPPAMSALWDLGFTYEFLLVLDAAAIASMGWLAFKVARSTGVGFGEAGLAGIGVAAITSLMPSVFHDATLGNVMTIYAGAIAVSFGRPGAIGSLPLGIVLAVAAKPFVLPYLISLAIVRRRDLAVTGGVALAVSLLVAALYGPSVYADYVAAVPTFTSQAIAYPGNVGIQVFVPTLAPLLAAASLLAAAVLAWKLDPVSAGAAAIALGLLAQPSLGIGYATVLIPAMTMLWRVDRPGATTAAVTAPVLSLLSPVLPALIVVAVPGLRLFPRHAARKTRSALVAEAARSREVSL